MSKPSPAIHVEEIPGDHYLALGEVQRLATPALAAALATTIRSMLADGLLAVENGRITLPLKKEIKDA